MLKKDLSHLPAVEPTYEADAPVGMQRVPEKNPTIGPALAEEWFKTRTHDDNLPLAMPDAGPHRGSDAGKCSRAIGYRIQGTEQSDPPTIADHWRMDLGSMIHAELQDAISKVTPGAQHELVVDLNPIGIPGSARMDILNPIAGTQTWEGVEIKTINGFGFKSAATTFKKSGPEGPRESHVIQLAINTAALAKGMAFGSSIVGGRLVYLSMELVSPQLAANIGFGGEVGRFVAEWFFPIAQLMEIAERESNRLMMMRGELESGSWVRPLIPITPIDDPRNIKVVNPSSGAAVTNDGKGTTTWACGYCSYKSQCVRDHADRALT